MYKNLREKIEDVISKDPPNAVLFSGGIDSTVILYESYKKNKNVVAITVGTDGKNTTDIDYSKRVAKQIGTKHLICTASREEIIDTMKESIDIIKTFNPEWVCSTTVLLLGIKFAVKNGLSSIASGEGADDIFGSFPFFNTGLLTYDELDELLRLRNNEISIMTSEISKRMKMKCILPFRNKEIIDIVFSIPIEERMKKNDLIKTKYPLRMAYKDSVPEISVIRPQTMAFSGSGVYDVIKGQGNEVSDLEFKKACKEILNFNSKLEYYLYKLYIRNNDFNQVDTNCCPHCKTSMKNKTVCTTCSTIKYKKKVLNFNE